MRLNLAYLFLFILFISCSKEEPFEIRTITDYPRQNEPIISTSLVGKVFDKNKRPVEGAVVSIATSNGFNSTTCNSLGVFEFLDVTIQSHLARISVNSNGKFDAFKNVDIRDSLINYTEIMMIDKGSSVSFKSSDKAELSLSKGARLTIPKNSIVDNSGNKHSGIVNVYSTSIDPTDSNFSDRVIGGLIGIDSNDSIQALISYGMIQIEIEDQEGNELNLLNTERAELSFPIPVSLHSSAPETIPFWYYDELLGVWIEEDTAIKDNSNYVVELKHFSSFNFDLKDAPFCLSGSISHNGTPFRYTRVEATLVNLGIKTGGWVNEKGEFSFRQLPLGEDLQLNFFDVCGNLIASKTIQTIESKIVLDDIEIDDIPSQISGTLYDCTGKPVLDGLIYYNNVPFTTTSDVFAGGQRGTGFQLVHCPDIIDSTVTVFDLVSMKSTSFSLSDNINFNNIIVCEDDVQHIFYSCILTRNADPDYRAFFGANFPVLNYSIINNAHEINFITSNSNPTTVGAPTSSNLTINFSLDQLTPLPFRTEITINSFNIQMSPIPKNGFDFSTYDRTTKELNSSSQFPWELTVVEYSVENDIGHIKGSLKNIPDFFFDSIFFDLKTEL